jgi:hypothetical protein
VNENIVKAGDFTYVFDRIRQLVIELETLNNQLDTNNSL